MTSSSQQLRQQDFDECIIVQSNHTVAKPLNPRIAQVAAKISDVIQNYVHLHDHGRANSNMLIDLPGECRLRLRPHVSFVRYDSWPKARPIPQEIAWDVVPVLCVEVIDRSTKAEAMLRRIRNYTNSGVRSVWVVSTGLSMVQRFEGSHSLRHFTRTETLDGGIALPGFTVAVESLFPPIEPGTIPESKDDE